MSLPSSSFATTRLSLFDPLVFRTGLRARNRIVLAPLTNMQSEPDGSLGDAELRWLVSRAAGGFSLAAGSLTSSTSLSNFRRCRRKAKNATAPTTRSTAIVNSISVSRTIPPIASRSKYAPR